MRLHICRPVAILVDWARLEANCGNISKAREILVEASEKAQDSHMPLYQAWAAFESQYGSPRAVERLKAAQLQIESSNASQHAGAMLQQERRAASETQQIRAALES